MTDPKLRLQPCPCGDPASGPCDICAGYRKDDFGTSYRPIPGAFIQWKGTNVCMDVSCICGEGFHVDADFAYAVRCPCCKQILEMDCNVKARPVTDAEWGDRALVEAELDA